MPQENWPGFARKVSEVLTDQGLKPLSDQNGYFEEGWFACTFSNQDEMRVSASMGYLDTGVRARKNLYILSETVAENLVFEDVKQGIKSCIEVIN